MKSGCFPTFSHLVCDISDSYVLYNLEKCVMYTYPFEQDANLFPP